MKITFWGVRGSIASPGPSTVRYGGNTTCIEVRTQANDLLILDAGTGIYGLSRTLSAHYPLTSNLLITHSHWDHIQGLPFFEPNFVEGNTLRLYGPGDPGSTKGIEHVLDVQLQHSYFPVLESELKSRVEYVTLQAGQTVQIGSARVSCHPTCHPVRSFGYRIEADGKSMFFTGDHEPPELALDPARHDLAQAVSEARALEARLLEGMADVDLLIADSSYTTEEQVLRRGWGHGTFESSMRYAGRANAKALACTHHEPGRSDDELQAVFAQALEQHGGLASQVSIMLAQEGMSLEL